MIRHPVHLDGLYNRICLRKLETLAGSERLVNGSSWPAPGIKRNRYGTKAAASFDPNTRDWCAGTSVSDVP
jgi:hypothetical protein